MPSSWLYFAALPGADSESHLTTPRLLTQRAQIKQVLLEYLQVLMLT